MANDLRIAVQRFTVDTGTGTQTFTCPEAGTVVGAMLFCSHVTADGTWTTNGSLSVGAVSGTGEEWCVTYFGDDAASPAVEQRRSSDDACVRVDGGTGATTILKASFSAFPASGLTLSLDTNDDSQPLLTIVFLLSTTIEAHASDAVAHVTVDTATDVTTPGFAPDVVLPFVFGAQPFDENRDGAIRWSVGAGVNDGADTQKASMWGANNAPTTTSLRAHLTTDRIGGNPDGGAVELEIDDYDANGFSVISRVVGAGTTGFGYMGFEVDGLTTYLSEVDLPTATGETSWNVGFKAQFAMLLITALEANDTASTIDLAGAFGISMMDGSREFCIGYHCDDGEPVAQADRDRSISDNTAVHLKTATGTDMYIGAFTSFTSPNVTINFSTAQPSTAKKAILFALEAADTGIPILRRRREFVGAY